MAGKPFSAKQKKAQLQERRQRKRDEPKEDEDFKIVNTGIKFKPAANKLISEWDTLGSASSSPSPFQQPEYRQPIVLQPRSALEVDYEHFYPHGSCLKIPARPEWNESMSREQLDISERDYLTQWMESIYRECPREELSYFEHNLEVWRQLWRVCEMSTVLVVVVDVRHPLLHLPPSLVDHVLQQLGKPMVVALMKTDLVDSVTVAAWIDYLAQKWPSLSVIPVSVYAEKGGKRYVKSKGVNDLLAKCREMGRDSAHAEEWSKLLSNANIEEADMVVTEQDLLFTIGFIGHPNVGKSSLINSLVGRKVVSASRTPGHTKHFQTIHLSPHIRLCDCPGLIFPLRLSKHLQILSGLYNVAQVRDPFGPIAMLMFLCNVAEQLKIVCDGSVLGLCEAFAEQRGFLTAKAARPDCHRAANQILRWVIDGRILLSYKPPAFDWELKLARAGMEADASRFVEDSESSESNDSASDWSPQPGSRVGGSFAALLSDDDDEPEGEEDG